MKLLLSIINTIGFLLIVFTGANAQQVISSTGGTGTNANGTLTYTLGEMVIDTKTIGSTIITQGFHQTKLTVTSVKELQNLSFTITAFPNPTNDFVTVKLENGKPQKISFILYDANGKALQNGNIVNYEVELSFISFNPGTYFLKIVKGSEEIKIVKIVKQ